MLMYVIEMLCAVATSLVGLALLAAYFAGSARRARAARKREAVAVHLDSVLAQAERELRERQAAAQASAALTAVLPCIGRADRVPRRVA